MSDIAAVLSGAARWAVVHGEALATLCSLPDECLDGFAADAPYSSGGAFRGDRAAATVSKYVQSGQQQHPRDFPGDNRDQRAFLTWCTLWLAQAWRACKPGAPAWLWTDWRQLAITTDAFQAGGFVMRGVVPWSKTEAARPQLSRFRAQCEYVVWGSKGPMPERPDVPPLPGFFEVYLPAGSRAHIAEKPVEICREIVRIVVPGGVVLDPFGGSMSLVAAALLEGRRAIGVDLDPHNVEIGRTRCANVAAGNPPAPREIKQIAMFPESKP